MFNGLSAFPLTPMNGERVDLKAVALLVSRAATAGVDSLGVLGLDGKLLPTCPAMNVAPSSRCRWMQLTAFRSSPA